MNPSSPRSAPKHLRSTLSWALLAAGALVLWPSQVEAQGRCSCNRGCHQFPGQCVQRGSTGCEAGFAPFCGTRTGSCPNLGWVSCGGECTCVRIAPLDAGVVDSGTADAPSGDSSSSVDRPSTVDVSEPMDAPRSSDVSTAQDTAPRTDAQLPADASRPGDASFSVDVPITDTAPTDAFASDVGLPALDAIMSLPDGAASTDATPVADRREPSPDADPTPDLGSSRADGGAIEDAGCECVGGACLSGVCYRDRCTYNPELGFICTLPGTTCRLVGEDALCIPICVGVTCRADEFCDDRTDGRCVADRCASIRCPAGAVCRQNQCGRWGGPDGGTFHAKDVPGSDDAGNGGVLTASENGCGCRAGGAGPQPPTGAWVAAIVGWWATRRRHRASARK